MVEGDVTRFEAYPTPGGEWRWKIVATADEAVLCRSARSFTGQADALDAAEAVVELIMEPADSIARDLVSKLSDQRQIEAQLKLAELNKKAAQERERFALDMLSKSDKAAQEASAKRDYAYVGWTILLVAAAAAGGWLLAQAW